MQVIKRIIKHLLIIILAIVWILIYNPQTITAQSKLSFDIYLQENGLPNNQIQCIYQDSKGWMWIGTSQGLSKFDGYNFVNYLPDASDSTSINGHLIRTIKEDSKGNLLIGTENGGLNIFDREKERFYHPLFNIPEIGNKEISVNDIAEDKNGNLWLATDCNIVIVDSSWNATRIDPKSDSNINMEGIFVRKIKFGINDNLWIGTENGAFVYNTSTNELNTIDLPFSEYQNREITEIFIDSENFIWIGTYSRGLFIIDPKTRIAKHIELNSNVPRTETVRSISKGINNEYWIGTRGGLFKYSKNNGVTGYYRHNMQEIRSLSNNSVFATFLDTNGDTWIGTRGGLNLLAKSKQFFHNYSALPGDNNYLNSNIIYAFWIDKDENIWIGTEDGGINIYNPKTRKYKYLTADKNQNNSISQNCIKSFLYDNEGNLWVGTYLGGIDIINLKTGQITHHKHDIKIKGSLSDNRVWDFCLDQNNDIWIATSKGINKFDKISKSFIHYPQLNGSDQVQWIQPDSKGNIWMGSSNEIIVYNITNNQINRYFEHARSMFEDSKNRIWITTDDKGFASYDAHSGAIKYYDEKKGLANNQALCILEDNENNLWISTSNGLSKFNPTIKSFQNFSSKDGLSNNQFNYGAACKTPKGELLFGSVSGFNVFKPSEVKTSNTDIPMVFTDLKVFSKSVPINKGKKPILKKSISETDHLELSYKHDVFTLEFAALNYVNNGNNLYSYKLEGFNRDWIGPSKDRTAPFTNLNPGNYTLRVKRISRGNEDSSKEIRLGITIHPPIWKTNWFVSLVIAFIIFIFYTLVKFVINREKIKNQLVIERVNARKLHELDMMKLKFFTNISHEIRTPLTLILGPLEKMLNNSNSSKSEVQENLKLMHRNAKNLDKLINQLLDFRKLQSGNLKLNLTEADIVGFIRNIVDSFNDYAREKEINLNFKTLKKRLFVAFDPDKIEKILNNLLSNAIKYTDTNGSITVNLSLIFDSIEEDSFAEGEEQQYIEICIRDTGKGISKQNLERIFLRFFQSDESDKSSGAGIGLSLVKELVKLHQGKIFVTSKPGKGTKFTIRIPYNIAEKTDEHKFGNSEISNNELSEENEASVETTPNLDSKVMLIVEDNADVRQFIKSHFKSFFTIHEATNGDQGWKKALETIPDIILSDIIMPNVDGYELCKRIKNDERTAHIPIILLTAMHSKEHELKGLTKGADDYITKPFDLSVLQAKVENILSIRNSLREKYTSTMVLKPTNVVISSPNEKFLQKIIDVIEENISDSELDIEKFSLKVGVSRMQLYRKLKALTNMTVKEFIRHIRLKRATQLLVKKELNISEIAYEVGFKDLSHFRKCFKREYGMSASEYVSKLSKN